MSLDFSTMVVAGIILMGISGVLAGAWLVYFTANVAAAATLFGLGSTALGTLGGVLVAPTLTRAGKPDPN